MTKLGTENDQGRLFELIRGELPCRISQETLKRRWMERSQTYHRQEPSHVSITKPSLTRDKIFSRETSAEHGQEVAGQGNANDNFRHMTLHPWRYLKRHAEIGIPTIEDISQKAEGNDLIAVESLFGRETTEATLRAAAESAEGIEALRALFVLRGDEISINEEHVQIALKMANTDTGADILKLFLFLRGDEITRASVENIARFAAANREHGAALMKIILDWYRHQDIIASREDTPWPGIVEVAVANMGSGDRVLQVLLDRYGDKVVLSEAVAKAAATDNLAMRLRVSFLLIRTAIDRGGDYTKFTRLLLESNNRIPESMARFSWKMLLHAAIRDDIETCKLLLETGQVEDDLKAIEGEFTWTPLLWAIYTQEQDVVKALVDTGKVNTNNVGVKTRAGQTALSWAAERGLVQAVEQLLRVHEINVNMRDDNGQTPLSSAVGEGKYEVVEALLKTRSVNVHARDEYDQTPLSRARARGDENIMQLLRNADELDTDSG